MAINDDGPETILVPAIRILVGTNLGRVHKGDHVLVIGNVIVSLDTSRPQTSVHLQARSAPRAHDPQHRLAAPKRAKPRAPGSISGEQILDIIRAEGPIGSRSISDRLELERDDTRCRAKVSQLLNMLRNHQMILPFEEGRNKLFRYVINEAFANANITSQ